MTRWNVLDFGSKTNAKVLAILMVAILTVSGALVFVTNSEASYYREEGGSITYHLGSGVYMVSDDGSTSTLAQNKAYSISPTNGQRSEEDSDEVSAKFSTYYGLKSTEYSPEFWTGWGEVRMHDGDYGLWNFKGPTATASWSGIQITVTRESTTSAITVYLPEGCTISGGAATSFTMAAGIGETTITVNYSKTINKVFGGWAYANGSKTAYQINGLSPENGDTYYVIGAGTLASGSLAVSVGDVVRYNGTAWEMSTDIVYPGDIVSWEVEDLYAKWLMPDLYAKKTVEVESDGQGGYTVKDIVNPHMNLKTRTIGQSQNYLTVDMNEYAILPSGTSKVTKSEGQTVSGVDGWYVNGKVIKTTYTTDSTSVPTGYSKNIKLGGVLTYYMKSDNTVYDTLGNPVDIKFYTDEACSAQYSSSQGNRTVYRNTDTYTVAEGDATNRFVVLYSEPVKANTYTVILVGSSGITVQETLAVGDTVKGVTGWFVNNTGDALAGNYTVAANDAHNGFIIINQTEVVADYVVVKVDGNRMFTSIYYLKGGVLNGIGNSSYLPSATYRTADPYTVYSKSTREQKIAYKAEVNVWSGDGVDNYAKLSGNVIIDNVTFSTSKSNTHGGNTNGALAAAGHRLILGTNISNLVFEKENKSAENTIDKAPVIVGGSGQNDHCTTPLERDKVAILNDRDNSSVTVNIGTYVIIHSGLYNNVMAGGIRSTVGSSSISLSTYAVLKDCLVADTIAGGGGEAGGSVTGHINTGTGYKDGGTFVYLMGAYSMGDYWQDKETGYVWDGGFVTGNHAGENGNTREYTYNQQSSVVQGGCHSTRVTGSSHLIISGDSSVWDCMAGGRNGSSKTDYAYLEITGKAEVRRLACGTITDGIGNGSDKNCVDHAHIYVAEDATVATIYGAGFDTYAYPKYKSMMAGTILVDIAGGRIGDVFGGGYRGSIGTPDDLTALDISIRISGDDTVIEGNVYGGGSGGLNKTKHYTGQYKDNNNRDGTYGNGFQTGGGDTGGILGNQYSTGSSYVYGDIDIEISGGTVKGSVYGGGMSVPQLQEYKNSGTTKFEYEKLLGEPCQPATVVGNITVTITGNAVIEESVYGAGQGIKLDSQGKVVESEYGFNKVIYKDGNDRDIGRLYWVRGGENVDNRAYVEEASNDLHYQNYAQVTKGTVTVIVENSTWYRDSTAVIGNTYTITASDANKYGFVVLHRVHEDAKPLTGFNVVSVGSDGSVKMVTKEDGQSVDDVNYSTWKVNGVAVGTSAYTVKEADADASRTIVLYERDTSSNKYTAVMIDGDSVSIQYEKVANTTIPLKTSHIYGSVYGGGGYGKVYGSTMVNIDSGIVDTNVFGGGLGMAGRTSIEGARAVYIENQSSIGGSVYGGSEVGEDGAKIPVDQLVEKDDPVVVSNVNSKLQANRSVIVMQGGYISGSLFGGGLMGSTYGNTYVYVGYTLPNLTVRTPTPRDYTGSTGILISVNSVFAGGNISTSDDDKDISDAYKNYLVQGSGTISIYGDENRSVNIPGSVMGSGNACLTRGETTIEMINLFTAAKMSGIHRATTVTIDRCNLAISGRNPITEVFGQRKNVSIFYVGELILKGGTSITFDTPIDDIGKLRSLTSGGSETTEKAAQNRLVFTSGSTIYVRYQEESTKKIVYGEVEGYVLMVSTQGEYGAYAMASSASNGGFSVNKNSTMEEADTSVTDDVCCWYISGISKKISTLYLQLANDSRDLAIYESYITINKFQDDTSIVYTGGVFTKMSNDPNGDPYTFVRPGSDTMEDEPQQLALAIGYNKTNISGNICLYDPTQRLMSIKGESMVNQAGTFFKKDGRESDIDGATKNRSLTSVAMVYSNGASFAAGPMDINLCLSGRPVDGTSYVGYLTLVFQEIKQVNYEAVGPDGTIINTPRYLVANTIELRADIYIYGSPSSETSDTFTVEVKTTPDDNDFRDGGASTLIPQTYSMAELNLERVDIIGAGSGSMAGVNLAKGSNTYKLPENGFIAPSGKTFSNWKVESGANSVEGQPGDIIKVANDGSYIYVGTESEAHKLTIAGNTLTIKPVWKTLINIIFDRNGGTGNIPAVQAESGVENILPGCPFTPPAGKAFAYWLITSGSDRSEIRYPGEVGLVDGDTVIKAIWVDAVVAEFDKNGGGSSMDSVNLPKGQRYTLPMCGFTEPVDNEFGYWMVTINDGQPVQKYPGDNIKIPSDAASVQIKAVWLPSPTMRSVTFAPNGGTGTMANTSVADGTKYRLPACTYNAPDEKIFAGWSVAIGGSSPSVYPAGTILSITDNTVVTATWSKKYEIRYGNGGGEGTINPAYVPSDHVYSISPPMQMRKAGCSFVNWCDELTGTYYYPSQTIVVKSNLILTAQWAEGTKVRAAFDPQEGSGHMSLVEKTNGYLYTLPDCTYTAPAGKIFQKWSVSNVAGGPSEDMYPGDVLALTVDKMVRAVWTDKVETPSKNYYSISFSEGTGGSGTMTGLAILKSESHYVLPESRFTAPAGKIFGSWTVSSDSAWVNAKPGQILYVKGSDAYIADGGMTVEAIMLASQSNGLTYITVNDGTFYEGTGDEFTVSPGDVVRSNGTKWSKVTTPDPDKDLAITTDSIIVTAQWVNDSETIRANYSSGVRFFGTVTVRAETNQDNTTGWSNLGKDVVWDLSTASLQSDSNYVGTLLGSIIGNVSFSVNGLKALDSGNDVFMPTVDLVFDRAGVEAHTTLKFSDIQQYSVVFIDHGIESKKYYDENTKLTRELCETPTGKNFNGWYLDSEFVNRYDYNMVINDESDGLRLYARYTYVVTLDCMNGVKYTLQVSEEDNGALLTSSDLPIPSYTGFTFDGWCKDSKCIMDWSYQSDRVYDDITLYARWIGDEVRVYFWYEDSQGVLRLFDGNAVGQAMDPETHLFDLQAAYMLNSEIKLYPTLTYGDTFDIRNPYTGDSILEYAQQKIDFGGEAFVKWTVASPTDSTKNVSIYSDTKVGSKVLKYVTDEMKEGCQDLWEYYLLHDGGYPRKDWVGEGRPDTMEIHLVAETTKVGIRVTMGLKAEDEKYSPTITIDDPEEFLVYSNGPNLSNPGEKPGIFYDEWGDKYYAGTDDDKSLYWSDGTEPPFYYDGQGNLVHDTTGKAPQFYWNSDGSTRYYYYDAEGSWTCLDEQDAQSIKSDLGPVQYIHYIAFPKSGYAQQLREITKDDAYGNTFQDQYLKSVAYAMVDGKEKKFLVEWNDDGTPKVYYLEGGVLAYTGKNVNDLIYGSNRWYVNADTKTNYSDNYKVVAGDGLTNNFIILYETPNEAGKYSVVMVAKNGTATAVRNLADDGTGKVTLPAGTTWIDKRGVEHTGTYTVASGDSEGTRFIILYESGFNTSTYTVVKVTESTITRNGHVYLNFMNRSEDIPSGMKFYLKNYGNEYTVTGAHADKKGATVNLKPTSGNYHEFVFKLNSAVRSGYTLHGWHNEYVSIDNALTPSADQIRRVHVWHDLNGYIESAKLMSADKDGNRVEVPLLVGDYVVDPNHADAADEIVVVPSTQGKPETSTVTRIIDNRLPGDVLNLATEAGDWYWGGSKHTSVSSYPVTASDADVEGIITISDSAMPSEYTVTIVHADGYREYIESLSSGDKVSLGADGAGDDMIWMVKSTPICASYTVVNSGTSGYAKDFKLDGVVKYRMKSDDKVYDTSGSAVNVVFFTDASCTTKYTHGMNTSPAYCACNAEYTVNVANADSLGSIVIKAVPSSGYKPASYTVAASDSYGGRYITVYQTPNTAGTYTVIKVPTEGNPSISRNQSVGSPISNVQNWKVKGSTIYSSDYTVKAEHADAGGCIVLYQSDCDLNKYRVIKVPTNGNPTITENLSVNSAINNVGGWHVDGKVISSYTVKIVMHECADDSTVLLNTFAGEGRGFEDWNINGRILDGDTYIVHSDDADAHGFIVLHEADNAASKYTVVTVASDGSATVASDKATGSDVVLPSGTWFDKQGDIHASAYRVDSNDADAYRFIVLYQVANPSGEYTVVKVHSNDTATATSGLSAGDSVNGVKDLKIKGTTIDAETYIVKKADADDYGSIVLATDWVDMTEYKVVWKNGNDTFRIVEHVVPGTPIDPVSPGSDADKGSFLGWKAASGVVEDAYIVSTKDASGSTITINALWEKTSYTNYRVILVSDMGGHSATYGSYVVEGTKVTLPSLYETGYRHTGWRIVTGDTNKLLTTNYYNVASKDADIYHDIIIVAEWVKTYTVKVNGNAPLSGMAAGDIVSLTYATPESKWKARDDIISKGGSVSDPDPRNTFTMKYNAIWDQIPYSVHLVQPANGTIEVYLEDREGGDTSILLTDEEVNTMTFYHGDKLRISYTPDNSKVSFIKWITTTTSYIENPNSASTVLVVQDDCSIAADESTGRMMDIMIAFDDNNLNAKDLKYTRVFMRDTSTGERWEATHIPGLVKMEHYIVKVPYGTGYEVFLWYGWSQEAEDGTYEYLESFRDAPDEYVLVGNIDVTISGSSTIVYDVISAGFIDDIGVVEDFVDTEYGMIERKGVQDPEFDFLFTPDEYTVVTGTHGYDKDLQKNGVSKYHLDSNSNVFDDAGHQLIIKFYTDPSCLKSTEYVVTSGATTVYAPIAQGSNGGNIVLYQTANTSGIYTVVKVSDSGNVVSIVKGLTVDSPPVDNVSGWFVKGRTINGDYNVKANDADAGGYIVLYKEANDEDKYNVIEIKSTDTTSSTILRGKDPGNEVTLPAEPSGTWYVRGEGLSETYKVEPTDSYPGAKSSALGHEYRFATTSGAGHPVRILDSQGNVVAKVTKYVGIQRSELAVLAARNLNINNPTGGTPPVVITFDPNLKYSTYEGFPWIDTFSNNVFALATEVNLAVGMDSNMDPQKTFYLNWVRTDSPADIIIHMDEANTPAKYATVDIKIENDNGGYQPLYTGIQYDLGTESGGYYEVAYPLDVIGGYVPTPTVDVGGGICVCDITSNNELHMKVTAADYGNTVKITVTYGKDSGWYALNDTTFGYSNITYGDGVYVTGSKIWGQTLVLPASFTGSSRGAQDIEAWVAGLPNGQSIAITRSGSDPFVYTFTKADSISTWNFIYDVVDSPEGGYIVVYEKANDTGKYTVVEVDSSSGTATVTRGLSVGDPVPVDYGWFVKGRNVGNVYSVNAADADNGGYIVIYQQPNASSKYAVVKVARSGATADVERPLTADSSTVSGVNGWYVNGGDAIVGNYTVRAADAHPNDYVKDLKQGGVVKYRVGSTNAVYDAEGNRVSTSLFKSRTCIVETAYDVNRDTTTATVYTDARIIFTPLVESDFITLTFSTFYGEFDYNGGQRVSVTMPAGGTMAEYKRNLAEMQSVSNFIDTYDTGDADEGGYIVLYQEATASGYTVIKVPTNGNITKEPKSAGDPVTGVNGWYVRGKPITGNYTVSADDPNAIEGGFIVIFESFNVSTTFTVIEVSSSGTVTPYRGVSAGSDVPAAGTWHVHGRTVTDVYTVYAGEWEYIFGGFFSDATPLFIDDDTTPITTSMSFIARWAPNDSNKKSFSYNIDGKNASAAAMRDAVVAEDINEGEVKKFVTDTEINMAIQPTSGYTIDLDRTRGELGYTLVGTEIYVDVTTAAAPDPSPKTYGFSSWKLWDSGSPIKASYEVSELTDEAKNGFLVYVANWDGAPAHAGSIALVFVTNASTPMMIYANEGMSGPLPGTGSDKWKLWNSGSDLAGGSTYMVNSADAVDGYIVFVKSGMELSAYTAVFASEYGYTSPAQSLDAYYKDSNGNKYHKTDVSTVYRYEGDSWVTYTVTNLAGHDGQFIVQFSKDIAYSAQNSVSYKATREGAFYSAKPTQYTATLNASGVIIQFSDGVNTYTVTDGVIKLGNKVVSMRLYKDPKMTQRITDLTAPQILSGGKVYSGEYTRCEPVQGFFARELDETERKYYTSADLDVEATTQNLVYARPVDVVETYMYVDSQHYVLRFYGCEYECFEDSFLQYDATAYGSQFKDIFGTVWAKGANNTFKVVSATVWTFDVETNTETSHTVTRVADLPAQYYLKDSYGNYYKGNYFAGDNLFEIPYLYLKKNNLNVETLVVTYFNENEYVKALSKDDSDGHKHIVLYAGNEPAGYQVILVDDENVSLATVNANVATLPEGDWKDKSGDTHSESYTISDADSDGHKHIVLYKGADPAKYKVITINNDGTSLSMVTDKVFGDTVELVGEWKDQNGDIHSGSYIVLNPDYLMKKNGELVNNDERRTAASGTLYYDKLCNEAYGGDYSMIRTDSRYSTDNEVRIDGITYHRDGYGNLYYDWLGTPTELPNNRGYSWTFLLKDNLELTIYTKEIAYNINFVLNGNLVKASDLNSVSTVGTVNSALDPTRGLVEDDTVELDSNTWYSGKTGFTVTKVGNNYVLTEANIGADSTNGFITLYKTANATGQYTVVKVGDDNISMYRCLSQGDTVELDSNTWYSGKTGFTVTKDDKNRYELTAGSIAADADNSGFIVLYRTANKTGEYTVLKVDDAKDYHGSDIPQYTMVAFDGPVSNRNITWYTDPDYNNEYAVHNSGSLLSPDRFQVDVILPTDPSVNNNTFLGWNLFGAGLYTEAQSVLLAGGSKHLESGTEQDPVRNYFYIFDAAWSLPGSTDYTYKIVYASQYTYEFSDHSISNVDYYKTGAYTLKNITEEGFNGWKVWNTGNTITGGTSYSPKNADARTINGINYILLVAQWEGEDLTQANNVVYASEYGFVPHMDSVRKYQCSVTRDITLYGHTGTYVMYLHDFNDEHDPMKYELVADEFNQITIPSDHYTFGNYLFVGWSAKSTDGKREYTYAPEESIYVDNLKERINLYPYYLSDGSGVKYYDGKELKIELTLDDVLAEKQILTKGDAQTTDMKVRYSHSEIDDVEDSSQEESDINAKHVGTYTVYFAAEMKTPKGKNNSDNSYGNTELKYPFHGSATLKILQVDAYVIAPSANLREGTGTIVAVSDPSQISTADTVPGNIVLTREDVALIGLVMSDVEVTKLYTNQADKSAGMAKAFYSTPGQKVVKADVVFTEEEYPYYTIDYNLKFIDGSLVVYPEDSSKYEGEEFV